MLSSLSASQLERLLSAMRPPQPLQPIQPHLQPLHVYDEGMVQPRALRSPGSYLFRSRKSVLEPDFYRPARSEGYLFR